MMSTTSTAMSHRDEPRERRFVNCSCPGVSMMSRPGTLYSRRSDWFCRRGAAAAGGGCGQQGRLNPCPGAHSPSCRRGLEALYGEVRGADLLRDAARLALLHVGAPDLVQQRRLARVDVAEHDADGGAQPVRGPRRHGPLQALLPRDVRRLAAAAAASDAVDAAAADGGGRARGRGCRSRCRGWGLHAGGRGTAAAASPVPLSSSKSSQESTGAGAAAAGAASSGAALAAA